MRYTRQMEEEKPVQEEKKPVMPESPVYSFDGFKIEVNEKVTLTPIQWTKKKKHG